MCIMYILYKGSNSPAKKSFLLYKYLINNKLKDFCSLCLYSCVTLRTKALKIILSYVYFSYLLQRDITKRFGTQILLQYLERISDAALSAYLWCCIYATPPQYAQCTDLFSAHAVQYSIAACTKEHCVNIFVQYTFCL